MCMTNQMLKKELSHDLKTLFSKNDDVDIIIMCYNSPNSEGLHKAAGLELQRRAAHKMFCLSGLMCFIAALTVIIQSCK